MELYGEGLSLSRRKFMATAVPASPSPEAGQPVEEQTQEQGGAGSGGAEAESAPGEVAEPKPKRQRKERLPGVVTRDDGEGIFDDLGYKSKTGKRVTRKEAISELEQEMREEAGIDIPEYPKAEPKKEAPAPKKFKFAGEEFDTQEAAEQKHKSLQGMFKPLNERVSKAEALAREAAESARYWKEQAEARAQFPTPPEQAPPSARQGSEPPTAKTAEQELQAALANVDGEMFETLAREKGLPLAGRYLAAQVLASVHDTMLPALRDEIMAQINPRLDPVAQSVEFQQQTTEVGNLFESMGQLKNPNGEIAFPEMNDENELYEVAELWASMDNPQPTAQSLIQAIAMYRLYRGARGGSQQVTPQVDVPAPQNLMPRPTPLEGGGPGGRPTTTRAGAVNEDTRFAKELDNADLVDRTLGFAVRRRR
jgi:hypothetical protein